MAFCSANVAAVKFAFVERDEKSEPGFDRRRVLVQFVAVKRIANFRAQRVARAEAAGFQAKRLADLKNFVPELLDGFVAADDFKSVLAGVAGARNEDVSGPRNWNPPIWFFFKSVTRPTRIAEFERAGNALR